MNRHALGDVGRWLMSEGYRFITVTPETHRRYLRNRSRRAPQAESLRDVFGWGLPFRPSFLPSELRSRMREAEAIVERENGLWASNVRFSTLGDRLLAHSAFPTDRADAVFFGPDTYRFCEFLRREVPRVGRLVDVGCGTGAGGMCVADRCDELVLTDINQSALIYASINAELAGVVSTQIESDILASVPGVIDAVIANPPYLVDPAGRAYRDGGGTYGENIALRMMEEALARLAPRGRLLLYTGVAIVNGEDIFKAKALALIEAANATCMYSELDPDVFGEELDSPAYQDIDRIAVVGLHVTVADGERSA